MHYTHYFNNILFKQHDKSQYLGKSPIIIENTEVNFKSAEFHSYDRYIDSFVYYIEATHVK